MAGRRARRTIGSLAAIAALAGPCPPVAAANVLITNLSDINFGALSPGGGDKTAAESVCTYSGLLGGTYSVTATGSGSGGAFTLAGPGSTPLPYEVQWSGTAGQTAGTALRPGVALSGQVAAALNCVLGLTTDASLIVILRTANYSAATAGSYSGTLSIMLSPN